MNTKEKIREIKNLEKELKENNIENEKLKRNIKEKICDLHPLPWEFIEKSDNILIEILGDRIIDAEGNIVLSSGKCPTRETILEIYYLIQGMLGEK